MYQITERRTDDFWWTVYSVHMQYLILIYEKKNKQTTTQKQYELESEWKNFVVFLREISERHTLKETPTTRTWEWLT